MKKIIQLIAVGTIAVAGSGANAASQVRIDCGDVDVILTEEQATTIGEASKAMDFTTAEFATATCDIFKGIDASSYADPTDVTVKMPSGVELVAQIQTSQN